MLGVHLGHHHGNVLGPAVGGVVGDNGALGLGVGLLQGLGGLFVHVYRAEHEVHKGGDLLHVGLGVHDYDVFGLLGDGHIHGPALAGGLFIGLAGGAAGGRDHGQLEPGVVSQEGDEALTHHAGAADHAYFIFFHITHSFLDRRAAV